uniref:Uncharacterized protein n=1 Tax=Ditylenchus dipsaci TaxID=166011 RepID=A0A915CMZ6_9BILA
MMSFPLLKETLSLPYHDQSSRLNSSSASYTSSTSSPIASQLQQQQSSSQFIVSTHTAGTPPGSKSPKPAPPVPPRHPNASAHLPSPLGEADSSSSISTNSSNHLVGGHVSTANSNNAHESSSMDSDRSRLMLADDNDKAGGIHQVRRNQATAIIVLGVMGAEFPIDLQTNVDLARATSHSLLELLVAGESPLLPLNSPLRRAAIDLLGRGFSVWQPHLDISKVLLGLLDLAAAGDKYLPAGEHFGAPLSPAADACRTARHSLSLIASARPQAMITALSTEVARYNSAAQHQTIQHTVTSPLLKSRMEVLRLIEQLSDKQYNCVAELIVPVGDILVHCLDTSLLKTRTLAEVFPPIAKFYMIGYCPATRRIAFGGKNGAIIVHELGLLNHRLSKLTIRL